MEQQVMIYYLRSWGMTVMEISDHLSISTEEVESKLEGSTV